MEIEAGPTGSAAPLSKQAATLDDEVEAWQRFTKENRCPVCGGYDTLPHGKKIRCWGFISKDKTRAYCTRTEHAGEIEMNEESLAFEHLLDADCPCGAVRYVLADLEEFSKRGKRTRTAQAPAEGFKNGR